MNIAERICIDYHKPIKRIRVDLAYKIDYYIEMCSSICKSHITGCNWYVTDEGDEFDYDYDLFVFVDNSAILLTYGFNDIQGAFDDCLIVDGP